MKETIQHHNKYSQAALLLLLTAAVLTTLGCQKAEESVQKTVPSETLTTAYQTEITQLLTEATLGQTEPQVVFEISDPNGPAPRPNPACYGSGRSWAALH